MRWGTWKSREKSLWWRLADAALLALALAAAITLWDLASQKYEGWAAFGRFLRDFATSAGLGGVAAVVAASIAFRAAMANVKEAQSKREEERWWASVEALSKLDLRDPLVRSELSRLVGEAKTTTQTRHGMLLHERGRRQAAIDRTNFEYDNKAISTELERLGERVSQVRGMPDGDVRSRLLRELSEQVDDIQEKTREVGSLYPILADWDDMAMEPDPTDPGGGQSR